MRAVFSSALLLAGLVSHAAAEQAVRPVTIKNDVNGVQIYVSATSWVTVKSVGNEYLVDARIFADLVDLQKKFPSVVGTLKPAADGCAKQAADNQSPVASLNRGSLWPREDQLLMNIRGDIDIWSCVVGPEKTKLQWRKKKVGFLNLKFPVLHTSKDVKKSKDGTQSFHGTLPVYLEKMDNGAVALRVAKPKIFLEGEEESLTEYKSAACNGGHQPAGIQHASKGDRSGEAEWRSPRRTSKIEYGCSFGSLQGSRRARCCRN